MTALERLIGRALGGSIRRLPPARWAVPALAVVLAVAGAGVALQSPPGSPQAGGPASGVGAVPPSGTPGPVAAGTTRAPSPGGPSPTPKADFWGLLYAFEATGPAYRSLADLGARSEAVVLGAFTGAVEPGREPCDEESLAGGVPREQACVFFANLPFRIDEVLAGSLPEPYRTTVKLEYMVRPSRQEALREAVPTDERVVLFIASSSNYLRNLGWDGSLGGDVYYAGGVAKGTFRDVGGQVVPLGLADDPEFGRLEGMPFDQFIELVRRVPILDLMPLG